jgi:hypothetical protein
MFTSKIFAFGASRDDTMVTSSQLNKLICDKSLSSTAIRRIYKEVLGLRKSPPAGIQVVESEDSNIDVVDVTLEGPGSLVP